MDNIRDIRSAPSYGKDRKQYSGDDSKIVLFPQGKTVEENLKEILDHPHLLQAIKQYVPENHPVVIGAPEHFEFARQTLPRVWRDISRGGGAVDPAHRVHPFIKRQQEQREYMYNLLGAIMNDELLDHLATLPTKPPTPSPRDETPGHKSFASPFPFARYPSK